jgi:glycosyltransferase involved in cell wall biosynthesis
LKYFHASFIKNSDDYSFTQFFMKLIFLVSSLGSGGAERVAVTLCNAWASRGNQVTLIATFSGGGDIFYSVNKAVEILQLPSQNAKIGSLYYKKRRFTRLIMLRNLIIDRQPDIVVSFLPNVNIAAILTTYNTRYKLIIGERSDPSARPKNGLWHFACKLLYRRADCLTVQTNSVATTVSNIYSNLKKVAVLPNPLPFDIPVRSLDFVNGDRKILLSLGRLSSEKQVDQIISAFSLLSEKFPEWDLHIYGDGPLRASLIQQVKDAGLIGRVRLMGNTSSPWAVMAEADLFVMASQYEGFPNALLEAMGVGLACVSTDCRSGPREISENGRVASLVPSGVHSALVEALAQLMGNDAARESLGRQARESVIRRYSLPSVLQAWDAVFDEIGVRR